MTANNLQYSGPRGDLFELYAHWVLQRGGVYPVQQFPDGHLSTPESKQKRGALQHHAIPQSSQSVALDTAQAFTAHGLTEYGHPNKSNFRAIDAAKKPNLLFQITVSPKHDINVEELLEAVRALGVTVSAPRLYFVVPPEQFGIYAAGKFNRGPLPESVRIARKLQEQIDQEVSRVEYWVLQLYSPASPPSSTLASTPSTFTSFSAAPSNSISASASAQLYPSYRRSQRCNVMYLATQLGGHSSRAPVPQSGSCLDDFCRGIQHKRLFIRQYRDELWPGLVSALL